MMAYLFFDPDLAGSSKVVPVAGLAAEPAPVGFTRQEWLVVALASVDRLSTLRKPGRFALICGYLFGKRQSNALANPRLEALRRMAVLIRHGESRVPHAEHEAFAAAGFSPAQYTLLVDGITAHLRQPVAKGRRS
jgi:alkylhydroperoxidase family enzyme